MSSEGRHGRFVLISHGKVLLQLALVLLFRAAAPLLTVYDGGYWINRTTYNNNNNREILVKQRPGGGMRVIT
ncbi:hypothetical protein [Paenibacillus graminis]|uniref:hypothetical protein n=1 Tax=Paenibacillus graminis TaxID=189425 RepID=UPI002DB68C7A|nr:hypothetical protein [Paenibacillus graminis]MEC0170633.1 hypothetical protein [Paenibacillus graminis]